jgi:pilus assembly protein CpaB
MARRRIFMVFVLAITAGGALALGTYNYVQQMPTAQGNAIPTQPVVVAATDLQIGAELQRDDLRIIDWPASAAPQGVFTTLDEVIGRGLVMPLIENEPVLPMKLAPQGAGAGLPPVIPAGLRAMSVRVNEVIGVAGYVLPGTRVDVLATLNPTESRSMSCRRWC